MVTLYAACPNYVYPNRNIRVKNGTAALIGADFVVFSQLESRQSWRNLLVQPIVDVAIDALRGCLEHPSNCVLVFDATVPQSCSRISRPFLLGAVLLPQRRRGTNACESGGCAADQTDVLGQLRCVRVDGQWPN